MKKVFLVMFTALACLTACHKYEKPVYQSVDEYPVKASSAEEVRYSPFKTAFSLWSPNADSVEVRIYAEGVDGDPVQVLALAPKFDGSWEGNLRGDLKGMFYTFRVFQNGRWLDETPGIFAKAVGINGRRGAIIDMQTTNPEGWAEDTKPELKQIGDAVIYEMHWRDFSAHASAGAQYAGKYLVMTEDLQSEEGLALGLNHLRELGVTHIHILPSYDFGSIDENGTESEARVLESGAAVGGNYNWGYDPMNYNVPEGSYSTNAADPATRIREFKQMVMACHEAGIRVILDVVFNHTYNVDGSAFTLTCPDYFYRMTPEGELGNASGCGNETASDRPMMRKFMVESCQYWLTEYHLDGFRFDLMGIHDIETMNAIREMADGIDPTIIIYGEGWACNTVQIPDSLLAKKDNTWRLNRIAAFSDDMRDALRGPFWDDHQPAFLASLPGHEERIKFGLVGSIEHPDVDMEKVNDSHKAWAKEPYQTIAYVSCHDDMCLVDRMHASIKATEDEYQRMDKLAQTAVLTSQGIPFIFCGEEVMRDKKGVHNSFCSPDSINAIDWSLKAKNKAVFDYYATMIALRKAHPAFHMGSAELVRENLRFHDVAEDCVVAYSLNGEAVNDSWGHIEVVLNGNRKPVAVTMANGEYEVYVMNGEASLTPLAEMNVTTGLLPVPALSAMIMVKK